MTDQLGKLAVALIVVLIIPACANLSPSSSDLASTATATASPAATATATRTPTQTPPPTWTPTPTITPAPTRIPVIVEDQDNGTTVVTDPEHGYRYLLPAGWERGRGSLDGNAGTYFDVSHDDDSPLDDYLERRVNIYDYGWGFTIHRQGITTNSHNTTLAFVEYSGTFGGHDVHSYEVFFLSNGYLVHFSFANSIDSARQAINMIQDSIQLLEP
jgi:hypothetical protein